MIICATPECLRDESHNIMQYKYLLYSTMDNSAKILNRYRKLFHITPGSHTLQTCTNFWLVLKVLLDK